MYISRAQRVLNFLKKRSKRETYRSTRALLCGLWLLDAIWSSYFSSVVNIVKIVNIRTFRTSKIWYCFAITDTSNLQPITSKTHSEFILQATRYFYLPSLHKIFWKRNIKESAVWKEILLHIFLWRRQENDGRNKTFFAIIIQLAGSCVKLDVLRARAHDD